MGRGLPAVWSGLFAAVVGGVGGLIRLGKTPLPPEWATPLLVFAGALALLGLYVQWVQPEKMAQLAEEDVRWEGSPVARAAQLKMLCGLALVGAALYLLFATTVPYVYPTATSGVGVFLFTGGMWTYWTNTLTRYYVTDKSVIREYRFFGVDNRRIPHYRVVRADHTRTALESFLGLGGVTVAAANGADQRIRFRNLEDPEKVSLLLSELEEEERRR